MKRVGLRSSSAILLVCFMLSSGSATYAFGPEWDLKKSNEGIKVYVRDTPGSSFKELKAVTTFSCSMSAIINLIRDIPSHTKWIYNCESSRIVKQVSKNEIYYFHETHTPWPVSNRYGVVHIVISTDSLGVVRVRSEDVQMLPDLQGKVRVKDLSASWTFTPQSNGTINGEYQLFVDPGGDVPAWLSNLFAVDGPYYSILEMKKMLNNE